MFNAKSTAAIITILFSLTAVFGQPSRRNQPNSGGKIFPLSDIKEGLKGTARTVFRGNTSEEFNVEILGVVPNWIGPKQDLIVGKLSGANAERTFVFAGMSGSPVYIDGKLVGAISYSFPFAKEPICGITPYEQMVSSVERIEMPVAGSRGTRSFSMSDLGSDIWKPNMTGRTFSNNVRASGFSSDSRLMAIAGQTFRPIATPVTFSGISQATLDLFSDQFAAAGILPVAASSGGSAIKPMKKATEKTLLGGDSVVVHLARGDISIAAAGTVTNRDGAKIYAFGHPFFSLGTSSLPMSESHVVTVIPNMNNSFKLAVPDDTVGSMTQDRATGIYGMLDEAPRMLPVSIKMVSSNGQKVEVNFDSAFDEVLTPLIVNAGVANTVAATERSIGDSTIEFKGEIRVKGEDSIHINRKFTGGQAALFAASATAAPLGALLRANFDGMEITGIDINMEIVDGSKTGVIERISVDRNQVRAGEEVNVQAFVRTESGKMLVQNIPFKIPEGTAPGSLSLTIGDGGALQPQSPSQQFTPKTAAELIALVNRLKRSDKLYVVAVRTSAGAVVGATDMPNLPPSVLATMNNDRSAGGVKALVNKIIAEKEIPPGEYIVSGNQTISVDVVR